MREDLRITSTASLPYGSLEVETDPKDDNGRSSSVYHFALKAVLWAFGLNLVIAALKLSVAMWVTRSAALFAEGLHSAADAFNSCSLLIGIVQGKRPPDRSHPFGYGLETSLWALLSTVVMFFSALFSLYMGVQHLSEPVHLGELHWAAIILGISVVLEIGAVLTASRAVLEELGADIPRNPLQLFVVASRQINQVQSPTTRFVFYEDALALLGAFIALVAVSASGMAVNIGWIPTRYAHIPDALASILIAILLLILSVKLFLYNRNHLTGAAAPEQTERRIRELASSIHGVSGLAELRTIDQGLSGMIVHLVVSVDPDIPIKDVDDLADRVKKRILQEFPNTLQVFVEVLANETEEAWAEQFERIIAQALEWNVLRPREASMLRNIHEFTHAVASDIMTPRTDVPMIPEDADLLTALDTMLQHRESRILVHGKQVDDMVGVLHIHDVIASIRNSDGDISSFKAILKEIDIYPENKPVSDLLEDFKRKKIQMAAVADEHGGFVGLITVEDVMEEIVGELWDEDDDDTDDILQETDQQLLVNGRYEIWELNRAYDLNIPDEEFKTIGGFVFGQLGREPEPGDEIRFEDLRLTVTECDGPRILWVRITRDDGFLTPVTQDLA